MGCCCSENRQNGHEHGKASLLSASNESLEVQTDQTDQYSQKPSNKKINNQKVITNSVSSNSNKFYNVFLLDGNLIDKVPITVNIANINDAVGVFDALMEINIELPKDVINVIVLIIMYH